MNIFTQAAEFLPSFPGNRFHHMCLSLLKLRFRVWDNIKMLSCKWGLQGILFYISFYDFTWFDDCSQSHESDFKNCVSGQLSHSSCLKKFLEDDFSSQHTMSPGPCAQAVLNLIATFCFFACHYLPERSPTIQLVEIDALWRNRSRNFGEGLRRRGYSSLAQLWSWYCS